MTTKKLKLSKLKPAKYNPRVKLEPGMPEYEKLKNSIKKFGYVDPIIVNADGTIIGGHQRFFVLQDLGYEEVECVTVNLSKTDEKALNIALNKISGEWDEEKLKALLGDLNLEQFDLSLTGFEDDELTELIGDVNPDDWFENRERNDKSREEGNDEYNEFLDKFEAKKTTDDCYTPDLIYDAVADWVAKEYNLLKEKFIRPFYPGGDYQKFNYGGGGIVVDNPPFSILAEIIKWYADHDVKFFLFAPSLTLFSSSSSSHACSICCGAAVVYENGASVATSFVTNLEDYRFRTAPDLYQAIKQANDENLKQQRKELPIYSYPDCVVTSSKMAWLCHYGIDMKVSKEDSYPISALESQKKIGKAIFGKGYLVSEKVAAEKAAAEKAAAHRWELSDEENEIVKRLGK